MIFLSKKNVESISLQKIQKDKVCKTTYFLEKDVFFFKKKFFGCEKLKKMKTPEKQNRRRKKHKKRKNEKDN